MVSLFERSRSTINEHILNIFEEGELLARIKDIRSSEKELKKLNALVYAFFDCRFIIQNKSTKRVNQDFKRSVS